MSEESKAGLSLLNNPEQKAARATTAWWIIVADGFTSNAVLKSIEGTAISIMGQLKKLFWAVVLRRLNWGLCSDSLREAPGNSLDYSSAGSTVLFGANRRWL